MFGLPNFHQMTRDPFLIGWNGSAFISIVLPLLIMIIGRSTYNNYNYNNNNNGNNNNNNNQYNNQYNSSPWWKFWGNNYNNYNNNRNSGGSQDQANNVPWWWFGGQQRRDREQEGHGTLIFVYIYLLLLYVGLILYGNYVFRRSTNFAGLQGALFIFTQMVFLLMILLAGLPEVIRVEGPELEETGWYGQFAVCLFLTCLFWLIQGIVFTTLMRKRVNRLSDTSSNYTRSTGGLKPSLSASSSSNYYRAPEQQHNKSPNEPDGLVRMQLGDV